MRGVSGEGRWLPANRPSVAVTTKPNTLDARLERALSGTGATTSVVSPAFLAELVSELADIGAELTFFAIWVKAISSSCRRGS